VREVVKAVIYKDHRYLFQLRDNNASISYPNKWSFFGGELDNGEGFEEALKRELLEELHWCPNKFFYLAKDTDKTTNCNINYYLVPCELPDHKLILGEGQAMKWFTINQIMDLNSICRPYILRKIIKQADSLIKIQ
jgi:8-oxo-dGTP pyrophosphatase MutT (NUDIX family)